jgi:hypothetical protein
MLEIQVNSNDVNIDIPVQPTRVFKSSSHRRYCNDPTYREIVINRVKDRYKKTKEQNLKKKELKNKIYELEQSIINLKKEKKEKIDKCIEELIKNIDFEYKEKVVDIQDQIEKIKTSIYLKDFQN